MSINNFVALNSMKDNSLRSVLKYFLFLGCTGFGGPLALIQQMRKDLARTTSEQAEFDQAFTMIKAMPGPIAFQVAVFWGQRQARFWGGLLAGIGIIFPAFLMMVVLAYSYDSIIENEVLSHAIRGAQYAVASIIIVGLYKLSKVYHRQASFWIFVILNGVSFYFRWVPETLLILGTGLLFVMTRKARETSFLSIAIFDDKLFPLFTESFKTGALVFGTGLAAFPFLQASFVDYYGWLDIKTFNDAISFGQMTPGPVTIAITFMGYKMAQFKGALVATVALFLPAFIHMTTWFPKALSWLSRQKWVDSFIRGSTAAVVGCVFVTVINMNRGDLLNYSFGIIFLSCLGLQVHWKNIPILKVIFIGAVMEMVLSFTK